MLCALRPSKADCCKSSRARSHMGGRPQRVHGRLREASLPRHGCGNLRYVRMFGSSSPCRRRQERAACFQPPPGQGHQFSLATARAPAAVCISGAIPRHRFISRQTARTGCSKTESGQSQQET
eukprot:8472591-Pyramimonas_sp.AAC.1